MLIGWLAGILGIFIGVVATIVWKKICRMEELQADLREKVLPQLITKDDFTQGIEVLQGIGQAFISRVETFMTACSEGKGVFREVARVKYREA